MTEDAPDPDDLRERLAALTERLDAAELEEEYIEIDEELSAIETTLDELEEALDDDEEDEALDELTAELADLESTLEEERGPYAEDIIEMLESVSATVIDEDWTENGQTAVLEAVGAFAETEIDAFDGVDQPDDLEGAGDVIDTVSESLAGADLHPDEDAEAIATALEAAQSLSDAVDAAETWSDLTVREKLEARGFYDILQHRKDYPPEWSALKAHEQEGNVEMILLAHELLDSAFMKEHCIEALKRLGPSEALEPMMQLAQRRRPEAIDVLGRIGDDEPVEMLIGFVEEGPNRPLELVLLQTLGRIGSEEATQTVANRLLADDPLVRSVAARSLGMIGDTRAIDPLSNALAEDDADNVRGSAAWALNEIGTEDALEAIVEQGSDDRAYLVEAQVTRARATLGTSEEAA